MNILIYVDKATVDRNSLAVFEGEERVGWFYVVRRKHEGESELEEIATVQIFHGPLSFGKQDVVVRWDPAESMVGLLIRGDVWCVVDRATGTVCQDDYVDGARSAVPDVLKARFNSH